MDCCGSFEVEVEEYEDGAEGEDDEDGAMNSQAFQLFISLLLIL
jgi:hypothetical protein